MLPLFATLLACQPPDGDTCSLANNDTCEELAGCPLGTDASDCATICDTQPTSAACLVRIAPVEDDILDEDVGSNGSGGLVGTWDGTVTVRGASSSSEVERQYRVYVPRRYNPETPTPVLFNLGGFTVDMYFLDEYTELNRTADLNNFIVVYGHPEWRDFGSYWVFSWYVYDSAWSGDWTDNPDLAYLQAVSDEVRSLYNIDRTRTYVSGHSRGGALSVIAAFELPDVFAGFAAQAGFTSYNNYDQRMMELDSHPAAYVLHGDIDPDVPVSASDDLAEDLLALGWSEDEDLIYNRLDNVTHRWQPQYNEQVWSFLVSNPLDITEAAP